MAITFPFDSATPEATKSVGAWLAGHVEPGDVVALYGRLGAGKTHFVKGFCAAIGVDEDHVSSPTFTLVNEYRSGHLPIFHFDAYRIASPDEFEALGFDEYAYVDGVCLIEWPGRIEPLLPPGTLRLHLEHLGEAGRRIHLVKTAPSTL
ncbi:MAG: tRNA (adenosine(37)-N6)-threonylcarbamoyltransferase complex ATPase subunit type 1 TsaE [Bacteroidota bacterium]